MYLVHTEDFLMRGRTADFSSVSALPSDQNTYPLRACDYIGLIACCSHRLGNLVAQYELYKNIYLIYIYIYIYIYPIIGH